MWSSAAVATVPASQVSAMTLNTTSSNEPSPSPPAALSSSSSSSSTTSSSAAMTSDAASPTFAYTDSDFLTTMRSFMSTVITKPVEAASTTSPRTATILDRSWLLPSRIDRRLARRKMKPCYQTREVNEIFTRKDDDPSVHLSNIESDIQFFKNEISPPKNYDFPSPIHRPSSPSPSPSRSPSHASLRISPRRAVDKRHGWRRRSMETQLYDQHEATNQHSPSNTAAAAAKMNNNVSHSSSSSLSTNTKHTSSHFDFTIHSALSTQSTSHHDDLIEDADRNASHGGPRIVPPLISSGVIDLTPPRPPTPDSCASSSGSDEDLELDAPDFENKPVPEWPHSIESENEESPDEHSDEDKPASTTLPTMSRASLNNRRQSLYERRVTQMDIAASVAAAQKRKTKRQIALDQMSQFSHQDIELIKSSEREIHEIAKQQVKQGNVVAEIIEAPASSKSPVNTDSNSSPSRPLSPSKHLYTPSSTSRSLSPVKYLPTPSSASQLATPSSNTLLSPPGAASQPSVFSFDNPSNNASRRGSRASLRSLSPRKFTRILVDDHGHLLSSTRKKEEYAKEISKLYKTKEQLEAEELAKFDAAVNFTDATPPSEPGADRAAILKPRALSTAVESWLHVHGKLVRKKLDPADLNRYRQIFNLLDDDGSGTLSLNELKEALDNIGLHMSLAELSAMSDAIKSTSLKIQSNQRRNLINFDEFVNGLARAGEWDTLMKLGEQRKQREQSNEEKRQQEHRMRLAAYKLQHDRYMARQVRRGSITDKDTARTDTTSSSNNANTSSKQEKKTSTVNSSDKSDSKSSSRRPSATHSIPSLSRSVSLSTVSPQQSQPPLSRQPSVSSIPPTFSRAPTHVSTTSTTAAPTMPTLPPRQAAPCALLPFVLWVPAYHRWKKMDNMMHFSDLTDAELAKLIEDEERETKIKQEIETVNEKEEKIDAESFLARIAEEQAAAEMEKEILARQRREQRKKRFKAQAASAATYVEEVVEQEDAKDLNASNNSTSKSKTPHRFYLEQQQPQHTPVFARHARHLSQEKIYAAREDDGLQVQLGSITMPVPSKRQRQRSMYHNQWEMLQKRVEDEEEKLHSTVGHRAKPSTSSAASTSDENASSKARELDEDAAPNDEAETQSRSLAFQWRQIQEQVKLARMEREKNEAEKEADTLVKKGIVDPDEHLKKQEIAQEKHLALMKETESKRITKEIFETFKKKQNDKKFDDKKEMLKKLSTTPSKSKLLPPLDTPSHLTVPDVASLTSTHILMSNSQGVQASSTTASMFAALSTQPVASDKNVISSYISKISHDRIGILERNEENSNLPKLDFLPHAEQRAVLKIKLAEMDREKQQQDDEESIAKLRAKQHHKKMLNPLHKPGEVNVLAESASLVASVEAAHSSMDVEMSGLDGTQSDALTTQSSSHDNIISSEFSHLSHLWSNAAANIELSRRVLRTRLKQLKSEKSAQQDEAYRAKVEQLYGKDMLASNSAYQTLVSSVQPAPTPQEQHDRDVEHLILSRSLNSPPSRRHRSTAEDVQMELLKHMSAQLMQQAANEESMLYDDEVKSKAKKSK